MTDKQVPAKRSSDCDKPKRGRPFGVGLHPTKVMRIPEPLVSDVEKLVADYRAGRAD